MQYTMNDTSYQNSKRRFICNVEVFWCFACTLCVYVRVRTSTHFVIIINSNIPQIITMNTELNAINCSIWFFQFFPPPPSAPFLLHLLAFFIYSFAAIAHFCGRKIQMSASCVTPLSWLSGRAYRGRKDKRKAGECGICMRRQCDEVSSIWGCMEMGQHFSRAIYCVRSMNCDLLSAHHTRSVFVNLRAYKMWVDASVRVCEHGTREKPPSFGA